MLVDKLDNNTYLKRVHAFQFFHSYRIPLIKGARKLIIAGDHLQLPPTIISKEAARKVSLRIVYKIFDFALKKFYLCILFTGS